MKLICPDCDQRVSNLMAHDCTKAKKSGGGVESRHATRGPSQPNVGSALRDGAGVAPSPPETAAARNDVLQTVGATASVRGGKFDKTAYQREYMRGWRKRQKANSR